MFDHLRGAGPRLYRACLAGTVVFAASLFAFSQASISGPNPLVGGKVSTATVQANLVRPGDMNSGALLLRSTENGKYVEAPRLATNVDIRVTGLIARAKVTQRFQNVTDQWVEGVYAFPLPENSAVDTLKMQIGTRLIEGKIKPREEARIIYERAKQAGKKASLIEQQRPNLFTSEVANIGPGETIIVQIEYQQTLRLDDGTYSLRFPLVVAPRFNPKNKKKPPIAQVRYSGRSPFQISPQEPREADPVPDRDKITPPVRHPAAGLINPVSLQVTLNAGFEIGEIKSHHHKAAIKRTGDNTALIALADATVPADRDFELTWRAKKSAAPTAMLFREQVDGDSYYLAMITPPKMKGELKRPPREIIFVIDNSGSMSGASMRQAKEALLLALDRLEPGDKFNVIRFDDTHELLFETSVDVTQAHINHAKQFISRLNADGGTEMLPALSAALEDKTPDDRYRVRQVVFLTDGAIGNEAQLFAEIAKKRGRSRVFPVGIGSAPNSFLMRRAAEIGRGSFTHIGSPRQVKKRMAALFQKLEHPAMTDIAANWPKGTRLEAWPDPLPDLYKGEPILLSAKVSGAKGTVTLSGRIEGETWSREFSLDQAKPGPGVAKLWARNKIAALEARRTRAPDFKKIDEDIEAVALRHHLVSRRTSLIAVDVTTSRPESESLTKSDIPVNLPAGWNFEKVFGDGTLPSNATMMRQLFATASIQKVAGTSAPISHLMRSAAKRQILLPQSATTADRKILIGIIALLFATMSALTAGLWRGFRRVHASPRRIRRRS